MEWSSPFGINDCIQKETDGLYIHADYKLAKSDKDVYQRVSVDLPIIVPVLYGSETCSHANWRTQEDIWEQGTEDNIWT
jgi:hypothetical protein